MSPVVLFAIAAAAMTTDAIGYTFGAIRPIEAGLAPTERYWQRRLRLNLLLANHGLYLAAAGAWLAVLFFTSHPTASAVLAIGAALSAVYSVITVLVFTRADGAHAIPRAIALAAYVVGALLAAFPATLAPPSRAAGAHPVPVRVRFDDTAALPPLRLVRAMHATALIEVGDLRVLTDPWWSSRRHYDPGEPLGITPDETRGTSLITSGQDHYDHSDFAALTLLPWDPPLGVPAATAQSTTVRGAGFRNITELAPWRSTDAGGIRVTAVPTRENVAVRDFDFELAYVYEIQGRVVVFVGHRMAASVAAEVARRFPRVDLALVAINDLRVRPQFMKQLSMSPDDAASVVHALGARVAVPIHYRYHGSWLQDALLLSHEGTPDLLADALHRVAPGTVLQVLAPGQPLIIE